MKKVTTWLISIILLGVVVSACSMKYPAGNNEQGTEEIPTSIPQTTSTSEINANPVIEIIASPTNEPTASYTPVFTDTPPTPEPSITPTVTATATPTETGVPTLGSTRISEMDQMEQAYIPAGEFIIGSEDNEAIRPPGGGRAYPEVPQHTLYLDGYWMDKYEVTNGQYALCVVAGACRPPFFTTSFTIKNYYGNPDYSNYPVVYVDWGMARRYCEWTGRRLPTEAEWEKAARGTDGRKYPWGNDPIDGTRANWCDINCPRDFANGAYDDGYEDTAPVGSHPAGASPYGIMDMAGNVWEWTGTLIQPYPYDPNDGRENLDANGERVWRGAAFSNGYWWMRTSVRYRSVTFYRYWNLGFRCASSQ